MSMIPAAARDAGDEATATHSIRIYRSASGMPRAYAFATDRSTADHAGREVGSEPLIVWVEGCGVLAARHTRRLWQSAQPTGRGRRS